MDPSTVEVGMLIRLFPLSTVALIALAMPGASQLISIRTVPITQSHQFDLFPSRSLAMGGVAIAVADSLHDPFANPAKGSRIRASRFFGAPGVYRVSLEAGAGRTLPVGALVRSGNWFGGASVAVQQIDLSEPTIFAQGIPITCLACRDPAFNFPASSRSNGNTYAFGMVGRTFPERGVSIAGSLFWAGLHGVDGVDLLYAGSARLRQRGNDLDLRMGVLKEWSGDRALSALLLHNRYAVTHDVFYLDGFWDPGSQQFGQRPRLEENLDHTNTWGLHLEYAHPIGDDGWRLGWLATANAKSHPKIPNYEIQNIPRDPGNSEAFNLGVGVSRTAEGSTIGIDLVYEPIWSYTWADTPVAIPTAGGATLPAGGRTIENRFRFSNAILRMGLSQDLPLDHGTKLAGFQFGLAVHRIDYGLKQRDNVQGTSRTLDEGWVEWSPTWGLSLGLPSMELRYRGSVTNGTGRPGVFSAFDGPTIQAGSPGNVLVAPSGPLSLTGIKVVTHQVSISFPFR